MSQSEHPALAQWRRTRESNAPLVVSSFYESLTRALTGGRKPTSPEEGDVVLRDYSSVFEAKGQGHSNPFRLKRNQFERYVRRIKTFPFEEDTQCYYLLFGYNAREGMATAKSVSTRRALLVDNILAGRGNVFLAERTSNLWVLPLPLVSSLFENGATPALIFPREHGVSLSHGINLTRRKLRSLAEEIPHRRGVACVRHSPNGNGRVTTRFRVTLFAHEGVPDPQLRHVLWQ